MEVIQGIHVDISDVNQVVRDLLGVIDPSAFEKWRYLSSWNMERRIFGPVAEVQKKLDVIHASLEQVSPWVSPGVCPLLSDEGKDISGALDFIRSVKVQMKSALVLGNRTTTLLNLEAMRSLKERSLDFTRPYVKMEEGEEDRSILAWLGGVDQSKYLVDRLELVETQTIHQRSLLESENYQKWKFNPGSSILVHGINDVNSSLLCASTVMDLRATIQKPPKVAIVYFFFDCVDHEKSMFRLALRSVIAQVAAQSPTFPLALKNSGTRHFQKSRHGSIEISENGVSQASDQELVDILDESLIGLESVYIILDSISSCTTLPKVLEWIQRLNRQNLHFMITNTPEPEFVELFSIATDMKIHVGDSSFNFETALFHRLENMRSHYGRTIERLFIWLLVAHRPLNVEEIKECLRLEIDSHEVDNLPAPLSIGDLLDICKDFVTSAPRSSQRSGDGFTGYFVHIAQHPARKILLDKYFPLTTPLPSEFSLSITQVLHYHVSKACLRYLLAMGPLERDADLKRYPLAEYAARHWTHHLKFSGYQNTAKAALHDVALQLLDVDSHHFRNWCRLQDPENPDSPVDLQRNEFQSPLYYVALLGLSGLTSRLLEKGLDPNVEGGIWQNPLHAAAAHNFLSIVQKLITAGAKHVFRHVHNDGPLAQFARNTKVLKLLLDHPPEPNNAGKARYYSAAVLNAAKRRNIEAIKMLLAAGANPNLTVNRLSGTNPIQVASAKGHNDVVEILLPVMNRKDSIEGLRAAANKKFRSTILLYKDKYLDEVLYYASKLGWRDVVEEILLHGAKTVFEFPRRHNWNNEGKLSALTAASERGFEEIVAILIANNADVKQINTHDDSLQAACFNGYENIVQQLLAAGAIPTKRNGYYGGAFQAAAQNGHLEILRLLIEHGTDVNQVSHPQRTCSDPASFGTAIQAVAYKGHEDVFKFLVGVGADINSSSEGYPSPLQCAISQGHINIVEVLLDAGAEIEQNDCGYPVFRPDCFGTSIHCAIEAENIPITELLITTGANINTYSNRDHDSCTPLSRAVLRNNNELVNLLLHHGADVNASSNFMSDITSGGRWSFQKPRTRETVLELACGLGHLEIVKTLIEKSGADVNRQGVDGWCALHAVAYRSRDEVLKYLIEEAKGLNVEHVLPDGTTALHTLVDSCFTKMVFDRSRTLNCIDILADAMQDLNVKDKEGKTVLHKAGFKLEVVEKLLKRGANPSLKDKEGRTPLDCALNEARRAQRSIRDWWEEVVWLLKDASSGG